MSNREEFVPWVDQLSPRQKDLLLYCFSTGFCMGSLLDPLQAYLLYEGFLCNPYVHSGKTDFSDSLDDLKKAMVIFLKTTAPDYESLHTVGDFDKCVDEYFKSSRGIKNE